MPRYYDMDKLAEMAQTKADTLLPPGNMAFSSVAKWLELLPAADVAPRAEVASEIFEEIERNIYVIETPYQKVPCLPYGYLTELKKKYQ